MSDDLRNKVLLVCGGRSTEHEISLVSCMSVRKAIDTERYQPIVAGIARDGSWKYYGDGEFAVAGSDARQTALIEDAPACFPVRDGNGAALLLEDGRRIAFDIVFPVMHGAFGEDGAIQGFFAMLGVPYVGCDFTASANCMDKALTKTLAKCVGIPTAGGIVVFSADDPALDNVPAEYGLPLFVKPAKAGSSVGITRVTEAGALKAAVTEALRYDNKVLVEPAVRGREIECAVLEYPDGRIFAASPGEVITHNDFYSYDAKYISAAAATVN
ncbi:MAG: D-alanine--D-alanine ligase, partial [Victivallales bacterium]|nr:D-alanine--D-alanine ligase [Victivallales bacterium]